MVLIVCHTILGSKKLTRAYVKPITATAFSNHKVNEKWRCDSSGEYSVWIED